MFPTNPATCRELPAHSTVARRQYGRHYEPSTSIKLAKLNHRTKKTWHDDSLHEVQQSDESIYLRYADERTRCLFQTRFEHPEVAKLVKINLNAQKDSNYIRLFAIYVASRSRHVRTKRERNNRPAKTAEAYLVTIEKT